MRKSILFLALSAMAIVSCNNLKDNEYEITGEVNASLNGKKAILQKAGGWMGVMPIDTVLIKDGKFVFKDTLKNILPEMAAVKIDGLDGGIDFVLEPGSIDVTVDKDTLYKSAVGGTYNNDKFEEFKGMSLKSNSGRMKFVKANTEKYMSAQQKGDTVTTNKLDKELKKFAEKSDAEMLAFIKDNPKAYYNLFIIQQVGQGKPLTMEDRKKIFDGLDESVKKTELGKKMAEFFNKPQQPQQPEPQAEAPAEAKIKIGDAAPQFSAKTPEGKMLSLKEAMGKVTIIDFWASWCGPCRAENPNVVKLYNEFHGKGLNIIGVSLDRPGDGAKWKEAIAKDKLTWAQVSNLKFWQDPIAQQYGVTAIPATFVIDANGKVVATNLRGEELKAKVAELLK